MQKLAQLCIRRPVFATMLILALVVMGLDAYRKLGVDFFPKVEFPYVTITTTLRGAAPEEVETQVSKRIEEAVNTISGIDDLRSISSEGISQVIIQFVLEKDPDVGAQEVRDKVSAILSQLPRDVDPPVVEELFQRPRSARNHQAGGRPHQKEHRDVDRRRPGALRR
ncbi:MAG: efflux RND transporter permease subunit [Acidobacteria bacterium]|nr:efflux RND transporter permease subunit [Acidobacteriota bacterium]